MIGMPGCSFQQVADLVNQNVGQKMDYRGRICRPHPIIEDTDVLALVWRGVGECPRLKIRRCFVREFDHDFPI